MEVAISNSVVDWEAVDIFKAEPQINLLITRRNTNALNQHLWVISHSFHSSYSEFPLTTILFFCLKFTLHCLSKKTFEMHDCARINPFPFILGRICFLVFLPSIFQRLVHSFYSLFWPADSLLLKNYMTDQFSLRSVYQPTWCILET